MYIYKVKEVKKVIDGDTFDFVLDLGFYATIKVRIRLADIDTYEIFGRNTHELGRPARDFAATWILKRIERESLWVRTYANTPQTPVGDGSFGRWRGAVYDDETGELLADALRESGFEKK